MPRQANGSYLQPANTQAVSLTTIAVIPYNTLETDIGNEITNSLDRNGRGGMANNLDMGNFRIKNVGLPIAGADAVSQNYLFSTSLPRVGVTGGSADAITATFTPTITSLFTGLTVQFKTLFANATPNPFFQPDALAGKQIFRRNNVNLVPGDIPGADRWATLIYDTALNFGGGGWTLVDVNTFNIGAIVLQTFKSSSSYVPNTQLSYAIIECWGGGGGGGGITSASGFGSGGGGGAGSYSRTITTPASIGAFQSVTIGFAGSGGGAGGNGGAGGTTSVGGLCIAHGGSGGAGASGNAAGGSGTGGTAGTGNEAFIGSGGTVGMAATSSTGLLSGVGGMTSLGGGGASVTGTSTGLAPSEPNSGAGGSGGSSQGSGGGSSGGNGAKGYVRVTEFLY